MIGRVLALAIGLLVGVATSQAPEFAQQYRQRLGGAIDELRTVVGRFDDSAQASGLSREDAIGQLRKSPESLTRSQGEATGAVVERLDGLERQRAAFAEAGPFGRLLPLFRYPDPGLARATYLDFEPAVPVTAEGFAAGGIGFLAGWAGTLLVRRMVWRLAPRRRRAVPA